MRILITNDDGIKSDGIKLLEKIAKKFSQDVWVVAPEKEKSGASHTISFHQPLNYTKISEKRYVINGTPVDCVIIAIQEIMKDQKIDLVLSGINAGCNIGESIVTSGTVAAAMEANLWNISAIAFSHQITKSKANNFAVIESYIVKIIEELMKTPCRFCFNVNIPKQLIKNDNNEFKFVKQGHRTKDDIIKHVDNSFVITPNRIYNKQLADSDIEAFYNDHITVTPLNCDFTDYSLLSLLKER